MLYNHLHPGSVGDFADDVAFVTLFPPALRPYLSPFADFCSGVCVLLGFHKHRHPSASSSGSPDEVSGTGLSESIHAALGLPSSPAKVVDPVAERRRAKAREQLDAKLAAMAAQDETWEDEEDAGEPSES